MVTVFATIALSQVLYGMTEESLLFREDWKEDNVVTRSGHSFNQELSLQNLQKTMFFMKIFIRSQSLHVVPSVSESNIFSSIEIIISLTSFK